MSAHEPINLSKYVVSIEKVEDTWEQQVAEWEAKRRAEMVDFVTAFKGCVVTDIDLVLYREGEAESIILTFDDGQVLTVEGRGHYEDFPAILLTKTDTEGSEEVAGG